METYTNQYAQKANHWLSSRRTNISIFLKEIDLNPKYILAAQAKRPRSRLSSVKD